MADCIKDAVAENHAQRTNSAPVEPATPLTEREAAEQLNTALGEHIAEHSQLEAELAEAIDPDAPVGPTMPPSEKTVLSRTAKEFQAYIKEAEAAKAQQEKEYESYVNTFSGATVGEASWWMNVQNSIASVMADSTAPIVKWAVTKLGVEGSSVTNHPLVQALSLLRARPHGAQQVFNDAILAVKNSPIMKAILDRGTSFSSSDIMFAAGDYLNALHAPERNAYLLKTVWPRELKKLENSRSEQSQKARDTLLNRIADLEANLDNPVPDRVVSSGYTNAQAEALRNKLVADMGITHEEFTALAAGLRDAVQVITRTRIAERLIEPDVLRTWPAHFEWFAPFMSESDNMVGAANDVDVYDPGSYHAIQGSLNPPQSAMSTLLRYGYRASNEIGMRDLANAMAAAYRTSAERGIDIGLQAYDYSKVMKLYYDGNPTQRRWAASLVESNRGGGGIVALLPSTDAEGNIAGQKRMLLTWKHDYKLDDKTTGRDLNRALTTQVKGSAITEFFGGATSLYGQMFTRLQPFGFAPVNTIRDVGERAIHIAAREYRDRNGNVVPGYKLLRKFGMNTFKAGNILRKALTGRLKEGTPEWEIWQSFRSHGLHLQWTRGMKELRDTAFAKVGEQSGFKHTVSEALKKPEYKHLSSVLHNLGAFRDNTLRVLDGWNDWFNNIAALSHYITLRDANLSRRAAAAGVLELMDLYQTGHATPVLKMLYPFVKPTVMSGAALSRTLGLAPNAKGQFRVNKKGVATFVGLYAAYAALMPMLKAAMGEDDDGNSYFDGLSVGQLSSFIPVGDGSGDYYKLPTAFGLTQVAITAAVAMDRVQRGLMSADDAGFEIMFALGKNVSPGNFPQFAMSTNPAAWFAHMLSPAMLQPLTELVTGIDYFGAKIERGNYDPTKSKASQGKLSTERSYHQFAKLIQSTTGMDLAPEQYKSLLNNLAIGAVRFIPGYVEQGELRTKNLRPSVKEELGSLGPFFDALGMSRLYGRVNNISQRLYFESLDVFQKRIASEGIDVKTGLRGEQHDAELRRRLLRAGWTQEDADDTVQLMRAKKELETLSREFNASVKPIWLSADESGPVKDAFDKYGREREAIYRRAVKGLNRYEQR